MKLQTEEGVPVSESFFVVRFQGSQSLTGGSSAAQKSASCLCHSAGVVYRCFPVVRRPFDCVGYHAGHAFRYAVGSYYIETLCVTGLQE